MGEQKLIVSMALKASGYKAEINNINKNTKLLKSEFEKAKQGSEDFEDSLEGQKAKLNLISGELENTKKKYSIYEQQVSKCEETLKQATKAFEQQEEEVKSLKQQINDYSKAYGESSEAVKRLETELKQAENALEQQRRAVINADNSLLTMKTTLNKTEGEVNKLEGELSQCENAIRELETGSKEGKTALERFNDALDEGTERALEFGENVVEVGEGIQDIGEKVSGVSQIIIEGLTKGVEASDELKSAFNNLQAQTGIATEKLEEFKPIIEGIYNNNFGESFEDVSTAVADVNKYLWLTGEELQSATEKAFGLRDTFGYDVKESVRSVDALMKHFGMSSDEAFNLIVQGAQNGLDFSGELLDTINEYSVQFSKAGLSAEDMFNILYDGTQTGAWNLDKIGDAVKEFNIRLTDGSDGTKEALSQLGFKSEDVAKKMSEGGEGAKKTYQEVINKIVDMKDKQEQNLVGVALFGTMWEDLGPDVIGVLADIGDNFNKTKNSAEELNSVKYDDLNSAFDSIKRSVESGPVAAIGEALTPMLESIIPVIQNVVDKMTAWIEANPELTRTLVMIAGTLGIVLGILGPLIGIIGFCVLGFGALSAAVASAGGIMAVFTATLGPVISVLGVIIGVVAVVAMAIYSNWEGIKAATSSLVQTCMPFLENLKQSFSSLWITCQDIYNTIIAPLFLIIGQIIEECILFAAPLLNLLMTVFSAVFNTISSVWFSIGKPVFSFLMSTVKSVWETFRPVFQQIRSLFTAVVNTISSVYNGVLKPVFNAFMSIVRKILSVVVPAFNKIRDTIVGAMNKCLSPIQWVLDKLNSLFGWIGKVTDSIGGFLSKINPFKRDLDTIGNATEKAYSNMRIGVQYENIEPPINTMAISGSYYRPEAISARNLRQASPLSMVTEGMKTISNLNLDGNFNYIGDKIVNSIIEALTNITIENVINAKLDSTPITTKVSNQLAVNVRRRR